MASKKVGEIKAALSALFEINDGTNKILDINSMITIIGDCPKKAASGIRSTATRRTSPRAR